EDRIRGPLVTGVQTCALPILQQHFCSGRSDTVPQGTNKVSPRFRQTTSTRQFPSTEARRRRPVCWESPWLHPEVPDTNRLRLGQKDAAKAESKGARCTQAAMSISRQDASAADEFERSPGEQHQAYLRRIPGPPRTRSSVEIAPSS